MAQDPAQARPALAQVPRIEDLPRSPGGGFDEEAVRVAFDTFRRSMLQLHAQLRVLQAAGRTGQAEPVGHSIRMDALRLIRAAAEFADVLERDAQNASAEQFGRVEEEVRRRHRQLQERDAELEVKRVDTERQCLELLNAARNEAREIRLAAEREADALTRDAEARGARLLEQSRHQATELTNAARADVAQTLDWARAQASAIVARAQDGAERLLGAAGLGHEVVDKITAAIMDAARSAADATRPQSVPAEPPSGPGSFARLDPSPPAPVQRQPPPPAEPSSPSEPPPAPVEPTVTPPPSSAPPPPSSPSESSEEAEPGRPPPAASAFGVPFGTPRDPSAAGAGESLAGGPPTPENLTSPESSTAARGEDGTD